MDKIKFNDSMLLEELMEEYSSLDFTNPDEVVGWISKMCRSKGFVSEKVNKFIAKDLRKKGFVDYKTYEKNYNYMTGYNSLEQFFLLDENKNIVAGNLVGRYISSLEFFGKPSILVDYLTLIYTTRFIQNPKKDKYEQLRGIPTFRDYMKIYKK